MTAPAGVTASARMSSAGVSGSVLAAAFVGWISRMAMLIMRGICLEAVERLLPACWKRSVVAMARIVALVDVAIEPVRPVKPGAGADEYSARKPIRTIVAVGCAVVRSIGKVTIRAHRSHPDVDGYLGRRTGNAA